MLLGNYDLGDKRLLIVADGVLHYVPFAALPDPAGGNQPLLVRHEIVSMPSASIVALLRKEYANRKPAPKALAVFADPVFSRDDARLTRLREKPSATPDRHSVLHRSLGDLGIGGPRLPRLPGTRREALAIAPLVPAADEKQALDF